MYLRLSHSGRFTLCVYLKAASKKEETTNQTLREAVYALCPFMDEFSITIKVCLIYVIDNQEWKVTQSMNAAELFAIRNTVNKGITLSRKAWGMHGKTT